jgi:hypothetical protein
VFWNGTAGRRLLVSLDNKAIGTLQANGVAKHSRICLPAWAIGTSAKLEFLAQRQQNNTCTVLNPARTFNIDNISIVNDPACPAGDLTDPGFERVANATGPMPGWGLLNGHVNEFEGGSVIVINNPNTAHSGNGVLRTSCSNQCISAQDTGADLTMIVPPAQGTAGPAVKFFARADAANANTETVATLLPADFQNEPVQVVVPETGAFVQSILCIPPALIGRRATVRFSTADPDGGGCTVATTPEFGFFDDIEITTDASCPAQ